MTNADAHLIAAESDTRRINWRSVGEYETFVHNAHDFVLEMLAAHIRWEAQRYPEDTWQRAIFRAQYQIIQDERKRRRSGDLPFWMRPNVKREESIAERCERVKLTIDLRDFVERECGVTFRGTRTACPIHGGDGLSFSVRDNRGKCFACDWSGDVISFAQEIWKLGRPIDAVKRLEVWG